MTVADLGAPPVRPFAQRQGGLPARVRDRLRAARLPWPVALYLFAVTVPIAFNAGPLLMTTLRLLLLLLVVPLTIRLLIGGFGRVFVTDLLFLAHLAWIIVALAVNNPDSVVQQFGSVGVEFWGGYLMGRAYVRTPEAFAALCRALGLIVCALLPFALYEAETGRPIIIEYIHRLPGITSVEVVTIEGRMGLERVQSVFAHPIHHGLFGSVAFSLTLVALRDVLSPGRRYAMGVTIALCAFLGLSSGAMLAMVMQMALIAWSVAFARMERRWWLLVGLFALAYVVVDLLSNRTPLRVFMSYATFSAHNAYWRGLIFEWGMKSVWAHPLFGIGLNDWVRPSWMNSGSMDNFWLVMAVRYGIPGFLVLAIGYAVAVIRVMRRDLRGDPVLTMFRRAWVFTFLGLSFTLCTVHVWTNVHSFVFFMFGAGMWMILAPKGEGAEPSAPAEGSARPASTHTRFAPVPRGGALAMGLVPRAR